MKLIEHRLVKFSSSSSSGLTRVVRISTMDKDATDSSNGDENESTKCLVTTVEKRSTRPKPQLERNARRRKKKKKTGNKFRGVRKRPWGRWAAEIRDPLQKKKLWIGGFDTAEEAAIAYDKLAILLRGPDAVTNFGSSSSSGGSNDGVLDPDPDFGKGLSQVVCSPTSVLSSLPAPESKSGHVAAVDSSSGTFGSAEGWNLAEDYGHLDSNFLGDCLYEESPPQHFAVEEVGMAAIPEEDEEDNSDVLVELDGDIGSCEWDVNNFFEDPPAVEFSQ